MRGGRYLLAFVPLVLLHGLVAWLLVWSAVPTGEHRRCGWVSCSGLAVGMGIAGAFCGIVQHMECGSDSGQSHRCMAFS